MALADDMAGCVSEAVRFPDAKEFYTGVGRRIAQAREEAHMTQGDVAICLQVYRNEVSRWERAEYRVQLYDLVRIANLFERPISWFFGFRGVDGETV